MAQVIDTIKGLAGSVDGFVKSIDVDDSGVPYFELVLGFMAVEYVFHTYLDIRQRQVRFLPYFAQYARHGKTFETVVPSSPSVLRFAVLVVVSYIRHLDQFH